MKQVHTFFIITPVFWVLADVSLVSLSSCRRTSAWLTAAPEAVLHHQVLVGADLQSRRSITDSWSLSASDQTIRSSLGKQNDIETTTTANKAGLKIRTEGSLCGWGWTCITHTWWCFVSTNRHEIQNGVTAVDIHGIEPVNQLLTWLSIISTWKSTFPASLRSRNKTVCKPVSKHAWDHVFQPGDEWNARTRVTDDTAGYVHDVERMASSLRVQTKVMEVQRAGRLQPSHE